MEGRTLLLKWPGAIFKLARIQDTFDKLPVVLKGHLIEVI